MRVDKNSRFRVDGAEPTYQTYRDPVPFTDEQMSIADALYAEYRKIATALRGDDEDVPRWVMSQGFRSEVDEFDLKLEELFQVAEMHGVLHVLLKRAAQSPPGGDYQDKKVALERKRCRHNTKRHRAEHRGHYSNHGSKRS